MCNLSVMRNLSKPAVRDLKQATFKQHLDSERQALKAKNDARAFSLLRELAKYQVAPSTNLAAYPTLRKYLQK